MAIVRRCVTLAAPTSARAPASGRATTPAIGARGALPASLARFRACRLAGCAAHAPSRLASTLLSPYSRAGAHLHRAARATRIQPLGVVARRRASLLGRRRRRSHAAPHAITVQRSVLHAAAVRQHTLRAEFQLNLTHAFGHRNGPTARRRCPAWAGRVDALGRV